MKAKAPSATTRLRDAPLEEEELCGTGLACRPISTPEVLVWTVLQVMGLLFQWSLWREVSAHLQLYDSMMAANCPPERRRHGICVGPLWNLTAWHEATLVGGLQDLDQVGYTGLAHPRTTYLRNKHGCHPSHDYISSLESPEEIDEEIKAVQAEAAGKVAELEAMKSALGGKVMPGEPGLSLSFTFETRSQPPTFIATVEPLARAKRMGENPPTQSPAEENQTSHDIHEWPWSLKVERVDPPLRPLAQPFKSQAEGPDVVLVEDLSMEARQAVQSRGWIRWKATLTSRGSLKQTRFAAYVEDSLTTHLEIIEANSQCSFTSSWKAFNKEQQGDNHNLLSWCTLLLAVFMPINCIIIFFTIWNEQSTVCCRDLGFHSLVMVKFLVVDVIQQLCIVLYLLGWYNSNGLRCQLCLFHPSHCEEEHPFRPANTGAFVCTLLSSVAHQMLVRPLAEGKKLISDEDRYFAIGLRILAISISILPFSTGVFMASSALLAHPLIAQILFFVPCALGWTTVFLLFCLWLRALCRECES